jgi:hypothetical protein
MLSATPTVVALATANAAAVYGQSVSLTASVTAKNGSPVGTVTFKDGSTTLGTATLNASTHQATLATASLAVGTHTLTAVYAGTTAFATGASAAVKESITKDGTATALAVSASSVTIGQTATFTATVAPVAPGAAVPTGTVTFESGTTILGTAAVGASGKATLAEYNWFTGAHAVTAVYAGDAGHAASTSKPATLAVQAPAYTKATDGLQTVTVTAGTGAVAKTGQYVQVDYTGYLTNGTLFDSSLNPGRTPFAFGLGEGSVIAGWDQGVAGMKVGETRILNIPPALGYGATANGSIPANSTLIFIVKLLATDLPRLQVFGGAGYATELAPGQAASAAAQTAFGSVKVGSASTAASFGLASADAGFALNLTGTPFVQLAGPDAADFVLTQPTSANGFVFTMTFKPKAKGTRTAVVSIATNDPDLPIFTFNLSGTGT